MHSTRSASSLLLTLAIALLLGLSGCSEPESGPAAENLAKGRAFLEANASKPGITTLPSGVQYKVISEPEDGRIPKLTDSVRVHLKMMRIDGSVVSDSHISGKPEEIYIKDAIYGFKKVLTRMVVGSKWIAYIPSHLAYSSRGYDELIAPNETLICEIELLEIMW